MNTFVISDTHFNHENIKKYEGRPDNFNELIVENWNKIVKKEDLVIHLGDVIMGKNAQQELPKILSQLNGKKILCRGNHDEEKKWATPEVLMHAGFDFVTDYFVYENIAYSHVPLTPLPYGVYVPDPFSNSLIQNQVILNIHGHFHRKDPTGPHFDFQPGYYDRAYFWENRHRYINVSHIFEDTLSPISLEEIQQIWEEKQKGGE